MYLIKFKRTIPSGFLGITIICCAKTPAGSPPPISPESEHWEAKQNN